MLQKNGCEPVASVDVSSVKDLPVPRFPESNSFPVAVTVCGAVSRFTNVIFVPFFTVKLFGKNFMPLISTLYVSPWTFGCSGAGVGVGVGGGIGTGALVGGIGTGRGAGAGDKQPWPMRARSAIGRMSFFI